MSTLATPLRRVTVSTTVGELAVLDSGPTNGVPVVFRHGIFLDSELWRPVAEHFAGTHRVVLIDAPGHGASSDPGRPYTLADDAVATEQVLDALGIDRALLIGHSWGGMTSARVALAAPERVLALALVNTPLVPRSRMERARYVTLVALLRLIGAPRWYGRQVVNALFDPVARSSDAALRLIEQVRASRRAIMARAMEAVLVRPDDISSRLHELTVPILAIGGADDYVLNDSARALLAASVPHATIRVVPGNHITPVEQPEALQNALRELTGELSRSR